MAGDWIKMRTDLLTSPKVVRMASALKADRFRIAGGLLSVWSLFDSHSLDGLLSGYSLETLDDLAAWPGFSAAMESVGWLEQNDQGLELPRFTDHNGASAKRRAQDADRKREVRKVSASEADKKETREEKRREEKKREKQDQDQKPLAAAQPEWIKQLVALGADPKHCKDWMAVRKQKRAPAPTDTVIAAMQREARKANITVAAAVQICAERGWQGFKADWLTNKPMGGGQAFPTKAERIEAANNAVLQEILAEEIAKGHIPAAVIDDAPAFAPDGDFIEGDFFHEG